MTYNSQEETQSFGLSLPPPLNANILEQEVISWESGRLDSVIVPVPLLLSERLCAASSNRITRHPFCGNFKGCQDSKVN